MGQNRVLLTSFNKMPEVVSSSAVSDLTSDAGVYKQNVTTAVKRTQERQRAAGCRVRAP